MVANVLLFRIVYLKEEEIIVKYYDPLTSMNNDFTIIWPTDDPFN